MGSGEKGSRLAAPSAAMGVRRRQGEADYYYEEYDHYYYDDDDDDYYYYYCYYHYCYSQRSQLLRMGVGLHITQDVPQKVREHVGAAESRNTCREKLSKHKQTRQTTSKQQ